MTTQQILAMIKTIAETIAVLLAPHTTAVPPPSNTPIFNLDSPLIVEDGDPPGS